MKLAQTYAFYGPKSYPIHSRLLDVENPTLDSVKAGLRDGLSIADERVENLQVTESEGCPEFGVEPTVNYHTEDFAVQVIYLK